jgi:hypothetical protein
MDVPLHTIKLSVQFSEECDSEEFEAASRDLYRELLEIDLENVEYLAAQDIPSGAKAGDVVSWGTIILTLIASGGVVTTLLSVLNTWLQGHNNSKILLESQGEKIEISGKLNKKKYEIIKEWLKAHIKQ